MQQLISEICASYIGVQYSKLLITLYMKPQTLESLIQVSQESYKHLIQKIKYLIDLNIITFEKSSVRGVVYSVNISNIMFFQRVVKLYSYIENNCNKQQTRILHYFLEVRTSNFDQYVKNIELKPQLIQRNKQIFIGLIKAGYLYEDQKALDLHLCQRREDDIFQQPLVVQIEQKQLQIVQISKKSKSNKKQDRKNSQTKQKQTKTKGKKKAQLKLAIDQGPSISPVAENSNNDNSILSKVQNSRTYFSISLNYILNKVRDELLIARLKLKFNSNKPNKTLFQMIDKDKYDSPFDIYNFSHSSPKTNLIKDIQTELVEEYIFLKFGRNSLLAYKTLIDSEYITQKSLTKLTLLQLKQLRSSINLLYVSGIIKSIQIKIERNNTLVFWVDQELAKKQYLQYLSKTCLNLQIIIERYKKQMLKQQNQGISISEIQQKLCRLQANLLDIDDCLILYNI